MTMNVKRFLNTIYPFTKLYTVLFKNFIQIGCGKNASCGVASCELPVAMKNGVDSSSGIYTVL